MNSPMLPSVKEIKDLLVVILDPVFPVYPQQVQDFRRWQTIYLQALAQEEMIFRFEEARVYSMNLFQITVTQKSWVVGPKYKIMDKALFPVQTKREKAAQYLQNL